MQVHKTGGNKTEVTPFNNAQFQPMELNNNRSAAPQHTKNSKANRLSQSFWGDQLKS